MPTDRAAVATTRPPTRRGAGDGGFSLIEVLVSMAIIGTVMAAAVPFMVRSLAAGNRQADQQVAIQVANDGIERVRALDPRSLWTGRGQAEVDTQWAAAPQEVARHLATMRKAVDPVLPAASTEGQLAPLPTRADTTTINKIAYATQWYVGRCWQSKASSTVSDVGTCTAPTSPTTTPAGPEFFRVLVAVTWNQPACTKCVYVASVLASRAIDPVFDTKRPAPSITPKPPAQTGYVGEPVTLQLASSGGRLPLTWAATGLPAGVTLDPATGLISGTPTAPGSGTVEITLTDRDSRKDVATFTWTVSQVPVLTSPGDQTSRTGTAVTLAVAAAGGRAPLAWAATGLPAGLSINASTGQITGTPTTQQTLTTTVRVTDAGQRTSSVTFQWRVLTPVRLTNPGTQTVDNGTNIGSFTAAASGGLTPYTWEAKNLPDGLTMSASSGAVTGTITHGTRYVVDVKVTDAAGGVATMTVVVIVRPQPPGSDLQVTSPDRTNPDITSAAGTARSFTATASSTGSATFAWTATGLPPGVSVTTGGVVGGTPTTRGTYLVRLTVNDSRGGTANLMFVWRVT